MSRELKSTIDIALEKMNRITGSDAKVLSDEQKRRIAEIKKEYEAKVAEKKIMLAGTDELAGELQKLLLEKERKIEAVYREGAGECVK